MCPHASSYIVLWNATSRTSYEAGADMGADSRRGPGVGEATVQGRTWN
jgi:hypothetical protein